jgi:hypothetical protein
MRHLTRPAVAIAMCLCAIAVASAPAGAQTDLRNPDNRVAPGQDAAAAAVQTDLRNADNRVALVRTDLRNPDNRVAPGHAGQPVGTSTSPDTPAVVVSTSSLAPDDGLSAFLIVLISVGGALLLVMAGLGATRMAHHHHPHGLT